MITQAKIISASRRTDIPAFYTPWFMNRIREGYAVYPNPMFPEKNHRVDLTPDAVSGIVFWTRYPQPLMPFLSELDSRGYTYYFMISLLNYPRHIEPQAPSPGRVISLIHDLAAIIGPQRVFWRYDPIILGPMVSAGWHMENFSCLAKALSGATEKVIVSTVDPYHHTVNDMGGTLQGFQYDPGEYMVLLEKLAAVASQEGLIMQSCAEPDVGITGITPGRCVDAALMERLSGRKTSRQKHMQRKGCLCQKSVDIGVNNTCVFGCRYCYATSSQEIAVANYRGHNPEAPWITRTPQFNRYRKCRQSP